MIQSTLKATKAVGSLQSLDIVVTRPAEQAANLLTALQQAGAQTVSIPLITIIPLTGATHRQRIQHSLAQLSEYQHAIFISQNAAYQTWQALADYRQTWPSHLQAYSVGSSTAAWLATQGVQALTPKQMNTEGLLALPELQNIQNQRCVIFRGLGGRETLAEGLRGRCAQVDYCELYRRRLPTAAPGQWAHWRTQHAAPSNPRLALVCLNSIETLDNLLTIDEHCTRLNNVYWLVPGERVAQAARARGFHQLIQTTDALDTTLLETLLQWQPTHTPLT
jgi:uroporphyrinogen-III synthase